MSSAAVVYAEQLIGRGLGLPLWQPEPLQPLDEVQIGDVGYAHEGAFIRLFNAMRPASDPINADGVPAGFVMLQPNGRLLRSNRTFLSPGPICTTTTAYQKVGVEVEGSQTVDASYTFTCTHSRGAVAVLGDHGHLEQYLPSHSFHEYVAKYHASWHDFAVAQDHAISPNSIMLVSGWIKTSQWAIATFANQGTAHNISLNAHAGSIASATFEVSSAAEVQTSIDQRSGPPHARGIAGHESSLPSDQCLFLKYYKLKRRTLFFPSSKVSTREEAKDIQTQLQQARPSLGRIHRSRSSTSSNEILPGNSGGSMNDPVDSVLDYILKDPRANAAVACYDDAFPNTHSILSDFLSHEDHKTHDMGGYLASTKPRVTVDEAGVGYMMEDREMGAAPSVPSDVEQAIQRAKARWMREISTGVRTSPAESFDSGYHSGHGF